MNLGQALAFTRKVLRDKQIEDASLEGEILLRYIMGINRARLFSLLEVEIDYKQEKALNQVLERRLNGEPTAYITGHREFYGLDFAVDRRVLIPRPESELLVEKTIEITGRREVKKIADIGTGSGAIAISLAVNLHGVTVYATDISVSALEVAAKNCRNHLVADNVILLQGDLLEPLKYTVDIIIANLPYVKTSELSTHQTINFEPQQALDGGDDGLDVIRVFCKQADSKLNPKGCLLLEIGRGQAEKVAVMLKRTFLKGKIDIFCDLAGIERVVSLCLT